MERFEHCGLESARINPRIWLWYVDDTFVVWGHGEEELQHFLQHINSKNKNIQFTMKKEGNGRLPFLDILVSREGNRLGHAVHRKLTHTDRYLNRYSNHHSSQKRGIIKTLADRARAICQPKHLQEEVKHLHEAFRENSYSKTEISRALRPSHKKHYC